MAENLCELIELKLFENEPLLLLPAKVEAN